MQICGNCVCACCEIVLTCLHWSKLSPEVIGDCSNYVALLESLAHESLSMGVVAKIAAEGGEGHSIPILTLL